MSRHLDGTGSGHPITLMLDVLETALDQIAEAPTWSLDQPRDHRGDHPADLPTWPGWPRSRPAS